MPFRKFIQAEQLLGPLPAPAYLWDIGSQSFVGSNTLFQDLLGYTEEEIRRLHWRDLIAPSDLEAAARAVHVGPTMKAVRWHWRHKNGQIITVNVASRDTTFIDDDGHVHIVYMAVVLGVEGEAAVGADMAFPT